MTIERALALRDRAAMNYRDLFSQARSFGLSHSAMLERRAAIVAPLRDLKAPYWVNSYLSGVWDTLQNQAYRDSLVFGGMVDGTFYSVHRDRPDYYEKHGIEPSAYADNGLVKARGHYWQDSLKPFFISEESRQ